MDLSQLTKYTDILGKGVASQVAPGVMKGILLELLSFHKVDVSKLAGWVGDNISLWDMIPPEAQEKSKLFGNKIGSLDWFTASWAIDAIKGEKPGLASLFLGWTKSHNWLERQLQILKQNLSSGGIS